MAEDIRGKTLSGSVLSLDAIGSQDANYLLGDQSNFVKNKQTAFPNATFQRRTQFGEPSTTYLGNTVKHVFKTKEMGDMLSNMYLKTTLPILSENSEASDVTIEFPSEVTASVPVGSNIQLTNSEIKRITFGPTSIDRYDGAGILANQSVSNNQYTGLVNQVTNVPMGYLTIGDYATGTKEGTIKLCSITDPNDPEFEMNVYTTTSNIHTPIQNPTVIDGGFKEMHVYGRHTASTTYGSFNLQENFTNFSNIYDLNTSLVGNQVLASSSETYSSLDGSQLSLINVVPKYGKFPVSSNTLTIDCPDSLNVHVNVQYSNVQSIISSDNRILSNVTCTPDTPGTILSLGDDFAITYYASGDFSNTIGASNVMANRPGYYTGNVTIKHSYECVGDLSLLFRSYYGGAIPETELTTIAPIASTVSLYANSSVVYPLSTFPLLGNTSTPQNSKFSNIHFSGVSTSIGDYRTDGSYNPLFEFTNQSRSTVVGVGLRQAGVSSNLNYAVRVSQAGGNSFITTLPSTAFDAYGDPTTVPFALEMNYTDIHDKGSGPQLVVDIFGFGNSKVSVMTGSPVDAAGINTDTDFLEALMRGGLNIRKLSENALGATVYFSYPRLDVYNGTTLETNSINVVASTTTIGYPGTDLAATTFSVTNGPNSESYTLPSADLVSGAASHATAVANVIYTNILVSNTNISSLYSNTRATEYIGTTLISESNGYMNVTTNSFTYEPIPTPTVSNVVNVNFNTSNVLLVGDYNSVSIPISNLTTKTLSIIYNPDSSNISNNDPVYTKEINSNLEYFKNSSKILESPILGGYDLLIEGSNFVFRNGDTLVSTPESFSNLNTFSSSNVTIGTDELLVVANVIGTTTQSILSGSTVVAPFRFSDVKLSSKNNGISYRNNISNGVLIDDQDVLSNLSVSHSQTLYSGPTPLDTNILYQSNVIYTQSNVHIDVNNTLYANTVYKTTYNPGATVTLTSYPDTFTIDDQTITDSQFSNLLTYSDITYNPDITYGETDAFVDAERVLFSTGFAQYASNLYCVGGIDANGSRIANVFKYDTDGALSAATIALTSYPEPVSYAQCALSSDKLFVFAPVTNSGYTKVLRYIDFDASSHTTLGAWKLESTGFTGATNSIFAPGFEYINNKLFVVGGNADQLGASDGIYYYDLIGRSWNQVTLGITISPVIHTPIRALGNKLYFFDGNNSGYAVDTSNAYSTESITGTGRNKMILSYDGYFERMYMTGTANVSYVDTTTNTVVDTGVSAGFVDGLTLNVVGSYNQRLVSLCGLKNSQAVSNIYTLGMTSGSTWVYTNLNLFLPKELSNAYFVGTTSPGDIPKIGSGIYYSSRNLPMVQVSDSRSSNVLQVGIKQSNIYTSVGLSSLENKGKFQNWYINANNSAGNIIDIGWDGKDYQNNYAQDGQGAGPTWAGDCINNDYVDSANTYASQLIFQNSSNILNTYMTFETTNPTGNTNPRADVVVSNVATFNVDYSNVLYMNDLLGFGIKGTVPINDSNDCVTTVSSQFNPFTSGSFNGYPAINVVYDTDNIPTIPWNFTESGGVITPPGDPGDASNVMIKDMYRQYLPSKIVRSGRVDNITFSYGASRYAPALGGSADTYRYGVYRGDVAGVEMAERKLSLVSIVAEGNQGDPTNYIEVYKYFSNVSNTYSKDRGWYDEIILSFGSNTTLSGSKEYISIRPGLGTDPVSNGTTVSNATQVSDTVEVKFENYDPINLSLTANVIYNSSAVVRTVYESKTIKLNTQTYNILSDPLGRSGNMVMYSTHNSGIISGKLDFGTRPVDGVTANFSQQLLATTLSSFRYDGIVSNTQENVFSSVFPVRVGINKYNSRGIYANNVGRSLIKKLEFSIGGQTIQETDDIWAVMKDEIFRTEDETESLKYLINNGADYLPDSPTNFGPVDLYIPLDLFFCRNNRTSSTVLSDGKRSTKPYLPLCAFKDQDITISVTFHPQTYFSNTSETIDLSYLNTFLITEEATISDQERLYFMNTPQKFLIETNRKLPLQRFNLLAETEQRYEGVVADFPVKSIHWVFRSEQFEDENDFRYFLHRYNFSTVVSTKESDRLYFEPLKRADFYIEGVPQIERFGDAKFYKYYQTLKSDLTSVDKNIYSYNFGMNPGKVDPEGSLNMSSFSSNKTFFSFLLRAKESSDAIEQVDTSRDVTIHAYAYGYQILEISDSRASLSFA